MLVHGSDHERAEDVVLKMGHIQREREEKTEKEKKRRCASSAARDCALA